MFGNGRRETAALQSSLKNRVMDAKGVEYGVEELASQRTPGKQPMFPASGKSCKLTENGAAHLERTQDWEEGMCLSTTM